MAWTASKVFSERKIAAATAMFRPRKKRIEEDWLLGLITDEQYARAA